MSHIKMTGGSGAKNFFEACGAVALLALWVLALLVPALFDEQGWRIKL